MSRIATGLTDAVAELQEISRGIHPATLSRAVSVWPCDSRPSLDHPCHLDVTDGHAHPGAD